RADRSRIGPPSGRRRARPTNRQPDRGPHGGGADGPEKAGEPAPPCDPSPPYVKDDLTDVGAYGRPFFPASRYASSSARSSSSERPASRSGPGPSSLNSQASVSASVSLNGLNRSPAARAA